MAKFMDRHPFLGACIITLGAFACIVLSVWAERNYPLCELLGIN
jgi:hypothetical protein